MGMDMTPCCAAGHDPLVLVCEVNSVVRGRLRNFERDGVFFRMGLKLKEKESNAEFGLHTLGGALTSSSS